MRYNCGGFRWLGVPFLMRRSPLLMHGPDGIRGMIVTEAISLLSGHASEATLRKLKFLHIVCRLMASGKVINRRAIYYEAVFTFGSQSRVDSMVKHYTAKFGCRQEDLNIRSGSRGIFCGVLVFCQSGSRRTVEGRSLVPDMCRVEQVECRYRVVLVVEEETVLDRVSHGDRLIVCGKGYPCSNTIRLLQMLEKHCRIVCLTDLDPYGLHIFLTYRSAVPSISRIGLCSSDLFEYKVEEDGCIGLSGRDVRMIESLKKTVVRDDALFIEGLGYKMELEAIFSRDVFEADEYLKKRCQEITVSSESRRA